ncbi:MAG: hypothetical protein ACTS9Y_00365 [Methylophilus sp.]|uniref:hypothetical protein n=1 Tax=Methylophilus sp. TaxID=29541 RepID=UPI003F9F1466
MSEDVALSTKPHPGTYWVLAMFTTFLLYITYNALFPDKSLEYMDSCEQQSVMRACFNDVKAYAEEHPSERQLLMMNCQRASFFRATKSKELITESCLATYEVEKRRSEY